MESELIKCNFKNSSITSIGIRKDDGKYELRIYFDDIKKLNEFSDITKVIKEYYENLPNKCS